MDWTKKSIQIPAGIHTVTWQYSKDAYVDSGSDCGWVDKVEYRRSNCLGAVLPLVLN